MIMTQHTFTIYQLLIFGWFCVGIGIVGFLSIRDLIKLLKHKEEKKN